MRYAVWHGLAAGAGLVAARVGINYQVAAKPGVLWAIDGGCHAVQCIIFGVILGLWR